MAAPRAAALTCISSVLSRDSYRDRDSGYGRPPPARYGGGFDSRGRSPPRGMGRRATPPATGLHMFVAGLNFICTERVRADEATS